MQVRLDCVFCFGLCVAILKGCFGGFFFDTFFFTVKGGHAQLLLDVFSLYVEGPFCFGPIPFPLFVSPFVGEEEIGNNPRSHNRYPFNDISPLRFWPTAGIFSAPSRFPPRPGEPPTTHPPQRPQLLSTPTGGRPPSSHLGATKFRCIGCSPIC